MSQAVVIKSNKYGMNLILDRDMPFDQLLDAIIRKFEDSANFFQHARLAISFEGRELTHEQCYQIIEAITTHTDITIICIVDNEKAHEDIFKRQIETYYAAIAGREGEFYKGTLRSGQVLECVSSIVIVGDVNPGAKIISQGNIIVLGSLKGSAYAGAAGNENCFVVALEMDPVQLRIGDISVQHTMKKTRAISLRRKEKTPVSAQPQMALIKGGDIYIEPIISGGR